MENSEWQHRHHTNSRARLVAGIAYLERRLAEMGQDGDCAYERAMATLFREQLKMRRELLERSNAA